MKKYVCHSDFKTCKTRDRYLESRQETDQLTEVFCVSYFVIVTTVPVTITARS